MRAGWERRLAPDNSGCGKGKEMGMGAGGGRRRSRPRFPNAFSCRQPGTRGRSAGVRGGEREPCVLVSASVGRA